MRTELSIESDIQLIPLIFYSIRVSSSDTGDTPLLYRTNDTPQMTHHLILIT